ncbi:MAG: hypothetical protein ACP5GX_01010 [Anaerolineae bacterium]
MARAVPARPPGMRPHSPAKTTISEPLSLGQVVRTWWPLAASWLLMSLEGPAHSAVAARLPNPEINLAAWGGIVFPICLIIESPIIMLLAASTARSKDLDAYRQLHRFTLGMGLLLTLIHVLVAFTPLYYFVVRTLMGAPEAIVEPARRGLMIMTPWSWAIAYRRFKQGVLIRFGYSGAVGTGTVVRLSANILVLTLGYLKGTLPGVIVAASAVATGVVAEAIYAGLRVRPVIRHRVRPEARAAEPPTFRAFLAFYVPLALTSGLNLLVPPITSAALSRMPEAISSLAVWSVLTGVIFILRSPGVAYNEVVVALMDKPGAVQTLRRFAVILVVMTTLAILIIGFTPISTFWFRDLSALPTHLASLGRSSLKVALLLPAIAVLQSWYQGIIVNSEQTRGITEAVVLYLVVVAGVLWGGVLWGQITGTYVGLAALVIAGLAQTVWLWRRSRPALRSIEATDDLDYESEVDR